LLGAKFVDIEEKYDLTKDADGFGEEGEEEDMSLGSDGGASTEEAGEEEV
jgi:hypothetical protein